MVPTSIGSPMGFVPSSTPLTQSQQVTPFVGASGVASRPTASNPFHAIREREFRRERQFLKGTDPSKIAAAYFTPSLREICAQVIAATFEQQPSIDSLRELDEQLYHLIIDQLRTDLKLEVSVPRIKVPEYWKACCEARWSLGQLAEYTGSMSLEPPAKGGWKRVYLERNLEESLMRIESISMTEKEEESIVALCTLCGSEIYALRLFRQRSHFDIYELFTRLPHLEEFAVSFGVINADVRYTPEMVGMKQSDALHIQKVLRTSSFLTKLGLSENQLDDDLCKAIIAGLVRNTTLLHLDLSHNRIGDKGAAAIGLVLLQKELELRTLNLGDNEIRAEGARALGDGLSVTRTLQEVSLRLNQLGDAGGETVLDGVRCNNTLRILDMSGNQLGPESARAFASMIADNTTLTSLDLSCNPLGVESGSVLRQAAERASSLVAMDLRQCDVAAEDEAAIAKLMRDRLWARSQETLSVSEATMQQEIDRLATERIRKLRGA